MESGIILKPEVVIDQKIKDLLKTSTHEAGQVIVHCIHDNKSLFPALIRIWPTTFLYDKNSSHISEMVVAENISYYPEWTEVGNGQTYFSLIFSGLPKSCANFDLIEDCKGGLYPFKVLDIARNESDVYYVQV